MDIKLGKGNKNGKEFKDFGVNKDMAEIKPLSLQKYFKAISELDSADLRLFYSALNSTIVANIPGYTGSQITNLEVPEPHYEIKDRHHPVIRLNGTLNKIMVERKEDLGKVEDAIKNVVKFWPETKQKRQDVYSDMRKKELESSDLPGFPNC